MPVRFVSGDLFANVFGAQALAHGCNCRGSMGRGIAQGFRDRYPAMYAEYRQRCKEKPRRFNVGDAWLWQADGQPWVFNLGTQENYRGATLEAIATALRSMRRQADAAGVRSIAVPRLGAGYGGLPWAEVRALIESVFADWAGTLYVYEDYVPASDSPGRGTGPRHRPDEGVRPRVGPDPRPARRQPGDPPRRKGRPAG
jgi:O-acetyl-ADP-ribose deacetylase (regulator of RNase III)